MRIKKLLDKIKFKAWQGYLFTIALVALATWLKELAEPDIIPANVPILYILAIVLTATFYGLGPSILCCVLSLFAYDYFFLPPLHQLTFPIEVVPISLVFFFVGIIISYMSSTLRDRTDEARKEAAVRQQSEAELIAYRGRLEELVKERTATLEKLYIDLTREIAEHKEAEQALRESEAKYRRIVETTNEGIMVADTTGTITFANPRMAGILGCSVGELVGKPGIGMIDQSEIASGMNRIEKRKRGISEEYDIKFRHKNGSTVWLHASGTPVSDAEGRHIGNLAMYTDITERKQAEQALIESEERLERSQEIAHLGSWELNLTSNVLTWSDEIYRIFGLKPQEFGATYEAFLEAVHPDDRHAVDNAYSGSVREGRDSYEIEHRIIRKDTGEVRYVHEKCQHIRDKSGNIIRSLGMVHDITERKLAEQALRESEERFRAIAEASPIQITVSRLSDGVILFTNHAYDEAFGFAEEELIGRKAPDLYVDPQDRKLLIQMLGEQGFLANYEVRVKQADGTPFWVSTSVRKIQFGAEPALLGASIDINDRKEIEEALQKSYDELEARVQERTVELAEANKALEIEIAGHKLARESVNVERRRFNEVLEMLPVYTILLTPDYHVPFANRFFRERFGESHGKRCYEYLFNRTKPCEICETYTVMKTKAPHHWEWVGPDKHNYDIYDFPFTDADGSPLIMEVGVDVTEQKRAQQALQKAHDELETRVLERTRELRETRDYLDNLFNYANAPIIVWNPDFKITRFNHAFEHLTGLTAEEVIGGKLDILFPDDTRTASLKHIQEATSGERWEVVEIPIIHKDGSVRILLWNSANIYSQDGKTVVATIAQGQDITERKKAEQMKDEFIGLVSHELRTPMTVINGSLRTAMSEGISPEDKDLLLQNAVEGADSLSAIMENLLELSRYQAGRLQLHTETVGIPVIARNIVERLKSHAESRTFRLDFPDKLPPVQADPVRVERILHNLLENAIKYSPDGSKIKVSARRDKKMVVTSVTDEGIGISAEDQGKVFELFERLGRGARSQGLGLGLVVCKRLVEAQGGRIWVESTPDKGSTFYFTLPAG